VRSVVALQEVQTTNYFGKNYQTSSEVLEYICEGIDGYNTFFQGVSPLVFRSSKATDSLNPVFALTIQPFDPSDSGQDLSDSVFLSGGAFISGVFDFNHSRGISGSEPGNPFFLLSCEQFILTVKGSGAA